MTKKIKKTISASLGIKPMSVNERSTVSRGRIVKTKAFRKYCDDLQLLLPACSMPFDDALELEIHVGFSNKQSDLDNVIKPFQDALQIKYGFNDYQITQLKAEKHIVQKGEEFIEFLLTERMDSIPMQP